jgi:TM2 domain-containing membrane protein YozV
VPGIGQFYNGEAKKGGIMLVACFIAWALALSTGIFFLAVGLLSVWSAVDAYRVAKGTAPV